MATSNRISVDIPSALRDQFIAKLAEAAALLPASPSFTPDERQTIPAIGDKLRAFDAAVAALVPQFPQLVPSYLSAAEAAKDRAARAQVEPMLLAVTALAERLGDLDKALGADLYEFDHAVYYSARDAAKRGSISGADTAISSLNDAYPQRKNKPATPAPAP